MSIITLNKIENLAVQRFGKTLGEYSNYFRRLAEMIEERPDAIFEHIQHESLQSLCKMRSLAALEFFYLYEALSYGDIGVLFAAPRTCLSGILIQWIGSKEQQEEYFDYIKNQYARTFFAATEPEHGSDSSQMETYFDTKSFPRKISISGEKILVGNLGVAKTGVIIGRTGPGLLNIRAVWIKPQDFLNNIKGIERQTLSLFGIKASLLGYAKFNEFVIPASQFLGCHLSPMERGLQAVVKTFNIMRLGIAGLALGHAQSVLDYVSSHRSIFSSEERALMDAWQTELSSIRLLAIEAGKIQEKDPINAAAISLVKTRASQLAEKISTKILDFFGENILFEHPFLMKRLRDCFGYEYMDGTTNIQRRNVYQGYFEGRLEWAIT